MRSPRDRSGAHHDAASEIVDTPADTEERNTDDRQVCDHGLGPLMYRSELNHFDGLVCGVCADAHLFEDFKRDYGICPACRERPSTRHWPESPHPEMVDGRIVYVKVVCAYRCAECAI